MAVIPRSEVERIIRKAGADRVSLDAPDALCCILEDKAEQIIERAMAIARHARGRGKRLSGARGPVLKKEDILLAVS